jgi:putative hemolysin
MFDLIGILAVLALVIANGFFVAAEFSLVSVRRSRVAEVVSARRTNATPALAHQIEPLLSGLPESLATTGSHAVAVVIAFVIITALHIVLGELAPKSLALRRSEGTALWVVRPIALSCFCSGRRSSPSTASAILCCGSAACAQARARNPSIHPKS